MIVIRSGTGDDLGAIAAIQSASGDAPQWAPVEYLPYDVRVAECESRVAGFLVTREVAPGEREILNVAVEPEYRRRGIASALIGEALKEAPGVYYLEVRESNETARRLYRRMGFEEVGVRRKYYSHPEEAAIVMRIYSCYCHSAVGHR